MCDGSAGIIHTAESRMRIGGMEGLPTNIELAAHGWGGQIAGRLKATSAINYKAKDFAAETLLLTNDRDGDIVDKSGPTFRNRSYPLSAQIEPLTFTDKESIYRLIERCSYE